MDLRQIKYFIAAAETGSISAAAVRMHIAQPAISAQIASLESDLGTNLFIRHTRGVELSEAGKIFLLHACKILETVEIARSAVVTNCNPFSGNVALGLPVTISVVLGIPLIDWAAANTPRIRLGMYEAMTADLVEWLLKGRLDIAVLYQATRIPGIRVSPLAEDDLWLIGNAIPALKGREEVAFCDLVSFPLLHTSGAQALKTLLEDTAHKVGITLDFVAEIDSIPQIKHLVSRGSGYTILPRAAVTPDLIGSAMQVLRIVDPPIRLVSFIASCSDRTISAAAQTIYAALPELTRSLISRGKWPGARYLGHMSA